VADVALPWFESVKATPGPNPIVIGATRDELGNPIELEVRATNLLHDPDVRGIVLHSRDISDRARAAEASRFALEVVERAPTSIVTTDANGLVSSWNPAAEAILGWTEAEVVGRRLRDLGVLTDESFGAVVGAVDRVFRGELVELETTYGH